MSKTSPHNLYRQNR